MQVESVLNKLYSNNSLNEEEFPVLKNPIRSSENINPKEFQFFISAKYNFETKVWKSWHFKILNNQWRQWDSNETVYRFPLLGFGWHHKSHGIVRILITELH